MTMKRINPFLSQARDQGSREVDSSNVARRVIADIPETM
jgi:hypothetical protein